MVADDAEPVLDSVASPVVVVVLPQPTVLTIDEQVYPVGQVPAAVHAAAYLQVAVVVSEVQSKVAGQSAEAVLQAIA